MNIRSTAFLFCLSLLMLWLFGLTLASKKTSSELGLILPTLKSVPDEGIESMSMLFREKDRSKDLQFFQVQPGVWVFGKNKIRVDSVSLTNILKELREAAKNDEEKVPSDTGLDHPRITVTIKPIRGKALIVKIGNRSSEKAIVPVVYVSTSDLDKPVAVAQASLDSLFFTNENKFRTQSPFQFKDAGVVRRIDIKRDADPARKEDKKAELEIKKQDDLWKIVVPAGLGYADFDGQKPPAPRLDKLDEPKEDEEPRAVGGVKLLIASIKDLKVEDINKDFLPASDNIDLPEHGLEENNPRLRIEVSSVNDKDEKKDEVLLIGKKVRDEDKYYARVAGDLGVFKLSAKKVEAILKTVNDPRELRSKDILFVDSKKIDLIRLTRGKDEYLLGHPGENKDWFLRGQGRTSRANRAAVDTLLRNIESKREIVEFAADSATDASLGLDKAGFSVALYVDAKPKEEEKKPEAKKDEKKETPFASAADTLELDGKDGSAETAFVGGSPRSIAANDSKLVKAELAGDKVKFTQIGDAEAEEKTVEFTIEGGKDGKESAKIKIVVRKKPDTILWFGNTEKKKIDGKEKEVMAVKRLLADGTEHRFYLTKELCDKIIPDNIYLTYLSNQVPNFPTEEVASLAIEQGKKKVEMVRISGNKWIFEKAASGENMADNSKVGQIIDRIVRMTVGKWQQKVEARDMGKFGLDAPTLKVTMIARERTDADTAGRAVYMLASADGPFDWTQAAERFLGGWMVDPGQKITLLVGKESTNEKDGGAYYALYTVAEGKGANKDIGKDTNDLLFLLPADIVKSLQKQDFYDRSIVRETQLLVDIGAVAAGPLGYLSRVPLVNPVVMNFDASKVAKVVVNTSKWEKRSFVFDRLEKAKPAETEVKKDKETRPAEDSEKKPVSLKGQTWKQAASGDLVEVDSEKVNRFIVDLSKLQARGLATIPDGQRGFFKLDPGEIVLKIELIPEADPAKKTDQRPITLTIGARFERGYFAQASNWPGVAGQKGQSTQPVFILPSDMVDSLLRSPALFFGKDVFAAGE